MIENWLKIAEIIGKYAERPEIHEPWETASVKILIGLTKMDAVVEAAKYNHENMITWAMENNTEAGKAALRMVDRALKDLEKE